MAKDENVSTAADTEEQTSESEQAVDLDANQQADSASSELRDLPEKEQEETEQQVESEEISPEEVAQELERTLVELEQLKSEAAQNWDQLLRSKADLDNFRRRAERDLENSKKFGLEKFVVELLPIKDSMEMGLTAVQEEEGQELNKIREGMDLTLKLFNTLLNKFEIKEINPLGEPFDPEYHEAMSTADSDQYGANTVMIVHQKGYSLNERLIRPAKVIVVKAQEKADKDADQA